ncbi:MAG: sensor histidine kinase [Betaproteobacteria bacterium]|nr:sensor histidine kinase [Betaproteobacteria bacterium]
MREVEESERRAISRELHDRIGQDLSTLGLILGSLGARLSQGSLRAVHRPLQDMQGLVKSMVANVRDVMAELRPPVLDDYGLLASLRQLVTEFAQHSGVAADLSGVDPQPRLPSIVETAMFRISQEALNNIAKHAQAKSVEVSLYAAPDRVVLEIADDGVGFDTNETPPDKRHWGLITMRERAEAIGIAFRLESAPGAGTRIVLVAERAAK